jgi:hypothetical protein
MTANSTPQESQEDYGDLLMGLGDDDLNDFDGLDDFGDDLDEASEQMHRSQREQASAKGKLELHAAYGKRADITGHSVDLPDPFFNGNGIGQTGFTSGHGRPVAPPSRAALERVKKMFAEVEQESALITDRSGTGETPNKRRKMDHAEQEETEIPDIPAPDFVMVESKGFMTGKGKAVPPPSKAAFEKAMKIIAAVEEEKEELGSQPIPVAPKSSFSTGNGNAVAGPSSTALAAAGKMFGEEGFATDTNGNGHLATPVRTTGFTTGSGAPAPMATEAARRKALAMFGEDEPSASNQEPKHTELATPVKATGFTTGSGAPAPMATQAARKKAMAMFGEEASSQDPGMATPVKTAGFTTGSGTPAPVAGEAARRKAMAMFGEESTGSPSRPTTSMLPPTSTPFRPFLQSTSTPQRPTPDAEPSTAFRTPLRTTTNISLSQPIATLPTLKRGKTLQAIEIKTPAPSRRVGLGRTPTSTRVGAKNTFTTPFKPPSQSAGSPLKPATTVRTSNAVAGPSGLSKAAVSAPKQEALVQVFNLTSKLPFLFPKRS